MLFDPLKKTFFVEETEIVALLASTVMVPIVPRS